MSYQVRYDCNVMVPQPRRRDEVAATIEEYQTEKAALGRVRELLEDGDHNAISVRDDRGEVLCGVRLQLKLGWFPG